MGVPELPYFTPILTPKKGVNTPNTPVYRGRGVGVIRRKSIGGRGSQEGAETRFYIEVNFLLKENLVLTPYGVRT
jgi:hypothetical protein